MDIINDVPELASLVHQTGLGSDCACTASASLAHREASDMQRW